MKHAILLVSSLALLSLVQAAAADVSILGGAVVVHTTGDPGVSALGNSVARVALPANCEASPDIQCTSVYGNPGGLGQYQVALYNGLTSCYGNEGFQCAIVIIILPTGPALGLEAFAGGDHPSALACVGVVVVVEAAAECLAVFSDPFCVEDFIVGEIVCST